MKGNNNVGSFLLRFILILHILSCYLVNTVNAIEPTPTDQHNDSIFNILIRDKAPGCIYIKYDGSYFYPQLDYISSSNCKNIATKFRYDVFSRISVDAQVEKNKILSLCLTEQTILKNGQWIYPKSYHWNYLILKPCVTDDPRQQWRYEKQAEAAKDRLVNIGSGYQIGEINWTLASSNEPDSYLYHFGITRDNNPWLSLKTEPRGYQFTFGLKWLSNGSYYRNFNDSSGILRYDPATNQVSRTDKEVLYCLTSNHLTQAEEIHKVWTSWEECYDKYIRPEFAPLKQQWVVGSINNSTVHESSKVTASFPVVLVDAGKNILRIKVSGIINKKRPYTYRIKYISEDKPSPDNPVTSIFYEDGSHSNWRSLTAGDNVRNLKTCPADGVLLPTTPKPQKEALLPQNFTLTVGWVDRLYKIVTSPNQSAAMFGACGTCAMQSMEMVMNFDKYQNTAPSKKTKGLLFKEYTEAPVDQFKKAYPKLSKNVNIINGYIKILADTRGGFVTSKDYEPEMNKFFASTMMQTGFQATIRGARIDPSLAEAIRPPKNRAILPGYLVPAVIPKDTTKAFRRMINQPSGTVWFFVNQLGYKPSHSSQKSILQGHVILLVKYSDGIGFIPTTVNPSVISKAAFNTKIKKRATTPKQLWDMIEEEWNLIFPSGYQFYNMDFYQTDKYTSPMNYFDKVISRLNCPNSEKGGARGFGSGEYAQAPFRINQCGDAERCIQYWYNPTSCP